MPLIEISHLDDPRLLAFSRMTDAELRDPKQMVGLARALGDDPESLSEGLFIGESRNVIERALGAGIEPFAVLVERCWLTQTEPLIERLIEADATLPVFVATREQMRALTGFERTRGALAAFRRPALPPAGQLAGKREARRRARERDEPHQHRRDLPLRRRARHRRGARHPVMPRPLLPPRGARVDGHGVPSAVDAHRQRRRLGLRRHAAFARARLHHLRPGPFRRLHPPAGRSPEKNATSSRSCWEPKATGWRREPSRRATTPCASPCRTTWTRSTWPPRAPWRFWELRAER